MIEVKDNAGNTICAATSSAVGIWSCEVDVSSITGYANPNSNVYTIPLTTYATVGLNTAQSIDDKTVVIDKIAPQIISVTTSTQWRKSGDVVNQAVVANESLSLALSIDKQNPADIDQCLNSSSTFGLQGAQIPVQMGAISDLLVNYANLANANGSFIVSGNAVEGRYCTTIGVVDLAGNTTEQTQIFFIDDTAPNTPNIVISDWGKFNGIYAKPGAVAKGRLVPEFVHEENQVKIKAWSEENTSLLFYVNGSLVSTSSNAQSQCQQSLEADKIADGVNVQDKDICLYEFVYPLTQNGKDYAFQVKSIDRAGNLSIISEDEVVYYDNQNPRNPEVLRTASPSYDPTPGWALGLDKSLTKDVTVSMKTRAESLSDLEFNTSGPQNFKNYIFTQTPGNQVANQTLPLGNSSNEREGCVQTIDTRRTGVCQDGNYEVAIKSTDAAGNPSAVTKHTVERDTVRPAAASLNVTKSGSIGNELLGVRISGERNATALITVVRDGKETRRINVTLGDDGNYSTSNLTGMLICGATKYTVIVRIQDKAGNISPISTGSITTQDCPRCVYDGNSLALPVRPDYIKTSGFRTPSRPDHKAIDMVRVGDTYRAEIFASGKGYVTSASHRGGSQWGKANYVSIKHDDGKTSYYWHLYNEVEQPITVNEGTDIDSVIGHMGNTGKSTATHLHFEVWVSGGAVNPEFYFTGKSNIDCSATESKVAGINDGDPLDFFRNIDLREELEEDDPNDLRLGELWDVLYEDGSKLKDMGFMERNVAYFEGAANFCAGIVECLWDNTLGGIIDTGKTIIDVATNFDEYKQQFDQIIRQIFSLKTLPMLIGIDIDDFIDSDYNTRMKYVGKAICEIGLFVFPYTTATKVLKVGKVGSIFDKVSDITKIGKFIKAADTVSDFLDVSKIAKKIGVTINDLLPVAMKLKKANDSLGVNSYGLGKSAEEVLESVGEIKLGKKITSSMTEAVGEFTMYVVLRKWKEQTGAMIDPKFREFKKRHGPDLIVQMGEEMPEELMRLGGGELMFIESKGSSTGAVSLSKLAKGEVQGSVEYLKNRAELFSKCSSCGQEYRDYWKSVLIEIKADRFLSIGIFTDTKNNKVIIYDLKDGKNKVKLSESALEDLTRIKE